MLRPTMLDMLGISENEHEAGFERQFCNSIRS
jgi:hypothetical protein